MSREISRRDTLKLAAAGSIAAIVGGATMARAQAAQAANSKISMGFVGVGSRGTGLLSMVLKQDPSVEIPAICDINEKNLNRALDLVEKSRGKRPEGYSRGPDDYRRMLERTDLNSVLLAAPQELHATMSIASLKAGKFVGSEVPAICTLEECWELVRTYEQTKTGYMMLENYCYAEPVMQVLNMVRQGVFGDLTYGFGGYIHEIRSMRFNADGSLTWRGENVQKNVGVIYPTHAIGPVAQWMGINTEDKLISMVAMASKSISNHEYAVKKFGADSAPAKVDFKNGDTNQALIKTAKGRLIELRYDTASPRPAGMGQLSLQGTSGAYESALGQRMVYLEGQTKGEKWEPLENYRDKYEHPRWRAQRQVAQGTGHGGGDYFVIEDFLTAIRTGKSPIDVYDAAAWSCIRPLSAKSIEAGGNAVEIPDFTVNRRS